LESGATGGNEVYASNTTNISFDTLVAGDPAGVDRWTGCNTSAFNEYLQGNHIDCAVNTYDHNISVMVGDTNITNVPASYTYQYDGSKDTFDFGLLYDGTNYVYVAHVKNLQAGYVDSSLVMYQMLLPTPVGRNVTYYFFTDPYDECPAGGLGENVNSTVYGHVTGPVGEVISGATVSVGGYSTTSDSNGFYNLSFLVNVGDHNLFATASGYDDYLDEVTVNFSSYFIEKNISMD